MTGESRATWGSPVNAHAGGYDAFAAKLNASGVRQWNTFMGSADFDYGNGIALDGSGNVYVTGTSASTWGTPVNAWAGGDDAFVAKIGDITVSPADVIKGLQVPAGMDVDITNSLADADGNGKVEMKDVLMNLRKIVGLE